MIKSKNKNKIYFFLGIIAALFIIGVIGFMYKNNKSATLQGTTSVTSKITAVNEQTSLYKITAEYPTFQGASPEFNNNITKTVTNSIENYKKSAAENWKSWQDNTPKGEKVPEKPESPWTYQEDWWSAQINDKYISFGIKMNYFTGGANMAEEINTFNYNFVAGKEVTLEDLFSGMPNYLNYVSDFCKAALIDQFKSMSGVQIPMDFIAEGTAPKADNFKNFTFTDSEVTFYFPKYQVAPGAYGSQKVEMPRDSKMIKSSFPDLYKKYFK